MYCRHVLIEVKFLKSTNGLNQAPPFCTVALLWADQKERSPQLGCKKQMVLPASFWGSRQEAQEKIRDGEES